MSDIPHGSGTCNWEYIVKTMGPMFVLKVRPLNTVYDSELSKPLLYPIERNDGCITPESLENDADLLFSGELVASDALDIPDKAFGLFGSCFSLPVFV